MGGRLDGRASGEGGGVGAATRQGVSPHQEIGFSMAERSGRAWWRLQIGPSPDSISTAFSMLDELRVRELTGPISGATDCFCESPDFESRFWALFVSQHSEDIFFNHAGNAR